MTDEQNLTHIDLFSGIGGFTLAAEWAGFKTVVFCEKGKFCQKVLEKRFGAVIADSTGDGLHNVRTEKRIQEKSFHWEFSRETLWNENWLEVATRFCRVDDGIPDRVHRLKALGNAIVPQIAYEILKNIAWIENNYD